MNETRMLMVLAASAMAVCSCGQPAGDSSGSREESRAADRALLDSVERPLERAREVEDIADDRKTGLDAEIEGAAE